MFRKIGFAALAAAMIIMMITCPAAAADDKSRTVVGADLTEEQISKVYGYFGIARGDVQELKVTNSEEHKYLSWLIADEQLGTKAISSTYILLLGDEAGITVETHNIDWVTGDMYRGALLTAGIYDANIIVAAPFEVSGTAALLGIYKAYEDITGTSLDSLAKEAGLQELFVAGSLSEFVGSDSATYLIQELKLILDKTQTMTDDELKTEILSIASSQGIELTDENIAQVMALTRTLEGLDVSQLRSKILGITQTFDKVKDSSKGIRSFFESVNNFFIPISEWFEKIGEWFENFFS